MTNNISTSLVFQGVTSTGFMTVNGNYSDSSITYQVKTNTYTLDEAVDQDIMPSDLTEATYVYVRVASGNITLKLSSTGNADQIIPCDSIFFLKSHVTPITNILASGTGDIEVILAGS